MGNKFEVWVWVLKKNINYDDIENFADLELSYHYVLVWRGESFIKAIWNLIKAKRSGAGCVKLEYR